MAFSTRIKNLANCALRHVGLKIETTTSDRQEIRRLRRMEKNGYFDRPAFALPSAMKEIDAGRIFECIEAFQARLVDFKDASHNPVEFSSDNDYFGSPDADVLYCIVRMYKPDTIVEVGCGHSTKISRLAILDGELGTRFITIDPSPRINVEQFSDQSICRPVEDLEDPTPFSELMENDILFIDSSHELKAGNDLVYLYLNVIPFLRPGVLIHIHDIFLPYDYPLIGSSTEELITRSSIWFSP